MIKHGTDKFYNIVVRPTQIVTRQSTDIYATQDESIAMALKFIHQNIDKNLQVEDVVKQLPLSRRTLELRFQRSVGFPIYKYMQNLRMEKFSKKLLETDQAIFDIALDLGFTDTKNVGRQFRQVYGYSPQEYRSRFKYTPVN